MEIGSRKVKIFRIKNRKGYAALCCSHLTEGRTPFQAYQRMVKALKRSGHILKEIDSGKVQQLVRSV